MIIYKVIEKRNFLSGIAVEVQMTVNDVVDILNADIVYAGEMNTEIKSACGCDMMSDVLAFVKEQSVLLTGLVNVQVVRTADMMDMHCIVFIRGKSPDNAIIDLAKERNISLLKTSDTMFTACGKLYEAGLRGGCCK
jgi:predicted transcriptional regulator